MGIEYGVVWTIVLVAVVVGLLIVAAWIERGMEETDDPWNDRHS